MTETVTAWRLFARGRRKTALSWIGAFRHGGRWNLPGSRVVYASESRALAALEILVHVEDLDDFSLSDWMAIPIEVPAKKIEFPVRYPNSWRAFPYMRNTQTFGSDWARSRRSVALRVPSAVVHGEFNILLNPEHPDFAGLKRGDPVRLLFDRRLGN